MSHILHIVRKDLRAIRIAWILWIALVVAQLFVALMAFSPRNAQADSYNQLNQAIDVLTFLWVIFGYLLTAAVVMQDPPVGTKAFWLTRPVSGLGMLASKSLWVLVFVVFAPAIVAIPWGIYCHFGAAGIAQEFLKTSLLAYFLLAPAFILAALAGNGPRFLLYNLLVFAVFVTLGMFLAAYRLKPGTISVEGSTGFVFFLISLIEAFAVINQYARRHWPTSLGIAVAGFLLLVGFLFGLTPKPPHQRNHPSGAPFSSKIEARIEGSPYSYKVANGTSVGINIQIEISGVPNDYTLAPGAADIELTWPDGSRYKEAEVPLRFPSNYVRGFSVRSALNLPDAPRFGGDQETLAKVTADTKKMLQRSHDEHPDQPEYPFPDFTHAPKRGKLIYTADFFVTPEIAKKIRTVPPSCSVTVDVFLAHPRIVATLPLDEVGETVADGARIRILSASESFDPSSKRTILENSVVFSSPPMASLSFFKFSKNIQTEDEITQSGVFNGLSQEGLPFVPLGHLPMHTPAAQLWRTDHWEDAPGWSHSLQLVAVHFEDAGGASRTIHIDHLAVVPSSKTL